MRYVLLGLLIGVAALGAGIVLSAGRRSADPVLPAQSAQAASPSPLTQRDSGAGAVEVEVRLIVPGSPEAAKYGAETQTVFFVSMNTHSVDLSAYDLAAISELSAAGRTYAPLRWVSASDNNHHRSGTLIFPRVDPQGGVWELRIKTIAGIPLRIFRWTP